MPANAQSVTSIRARIMDGASVTEISQAVREAISGFEEGTLPFEQAMEVSSIGFRAMQDGTDSDPSLGLQVILRELLPLCFVVGPEVPEGKSYYLDRFREQLNRWIGQYPEGDRNLIRGAVLDRVVVVLRGGEPEGAIWTAAELGYRRLDLVEALWNVAAGGENVESEDAALSALASLGVPRRERSRLLAALLPRADNRWSIPLWGALGRLSDPRSIAVVERRWVNPSHGGLLPDHAYLSLTTLADIADMRQGDDHLQDMIWGRVAGAVEAHFDDLAGAVYLGNIATRCDSPQVIVSLLNWMHSFERSKGHEHQRYLLTLRLDECVRPRQVGGWAQLDSPPAIRLLGKAAKTDTAVSIPGQTFDALIKETSWDVLLRMGHEPALSWYTASVGQETNPWVQSKISQKLACFQLVPVPKRAIQLVKETYDAQRGDSAELVKRTAAIDIAMSSPSPTTFHALLAFGFTYDGHVLSDSVEALEAVAQVLYSRGEHWVVASLLKCVLHPPAPRHQYAALAVLASLAPYQALTGAGVRALTGLLVPQVSLPPVHRGLLIKTLGMLPQGQLPPEAIREIEGFALDERDDSQLKWRAIEALARQGQLGERPDLVTRTLGLLRRNGKWYLPDSVPISSERAFVVILLAAERASEYMPSIMSLIDRGDWATMAQTMSGLSWMQRHSLAQKDFNQIAETAAQRARRDRDPFSPTAFVFGALAEEAPNVLAHGKWQEVWQDWQPHIRSALADALHAAHYESSEERDLATSLLLDICRDGQYGVRRAAYRGLNRHAPRTLVRACRTWSKSPHSELRRRAAEAIAWVGADASKPSFSTRVRDLLDSDPDESVRSAATRSRSEKRQREWSDLYLRQVIKLNGQSNEEILSKWKYGAALAQTGDDESQRQLQIRLRDSTLLPHTRHWLGIIIHDLQEQWNKTQKGWPEPLRFWDGELIVD